ncbi:hypothetical protein [Microvirga yunnanensis]|uniref:hypothetical protein n=1 Tax=Microvirga yunnanensis TaxID=2953740 RepID=UPI0021C5C74B|nr:hypothetical protein [Microvirga sp. HBU65207]
MSGDDLNERAGELLSMAGPAGMLFVRPYMDQHGRTCDPRDEETELLQKGYLVAGQSDREVVRYPLTAKALSYLAARHVRRM